MLLINIVIITQTLHGTAIYAYIGVVLGGQCRHIFSPMECLGNGPRGDSMTSVLTVSATDSATSRHTNRGDGGLGRSGRERQDTPRLGHACLS